jgi:hypothetical protein
MYSLPMIRLSLCEPYNGWKIVAPIDLKTGDITSCEFEHRKNQFNQMNITFSPDFSRYQDITKGKTWGVRLQTDTLDLGFIYYDAIVRPFGLYECKLMSGAYLIQSEFIDNKDRFYSGSLASFLGELTSGAVFTPLGVDTNIEIVTGVLNQLELLDEAIRYPDFFEWVDAGLYDTGGGVMKPEIIYGDFRQIQSYYETSNDERYKPVQVNNFSSIDNTEDTSIVYVEEYKISRQYERPTLLYPYVDNGTGSAQNTRTELTQTNPSWLIPPFEIVERVSPITGQITRYVRNPFTQNYRERIQVYVIDNTSNTEDSNGSTQVNNEVSEQLLYRRAIWYLSAMSNEDTYSIKPIIKKIILAGTLAKMDFVSNTTGQDDSQKTNISITDNRIFDNLTYNLNTIYD